MSGDGWTSRLLTGLAGHLDERGVGVWRTPESGEPYTADETGIVIGAMPDDPARCIVLAAYPISEHVSLANVAVGVQVRCRAGADPCDVQDLDDAVFDALHGATNLVLNDIDVIQIYRRSSASLGQARDQTARWERVSNYYLDAMRDSTHRPY